ncbi:hypothetical protein JW872_03065 [Candidatus Babeliales bacterium]|nr:hypothetical protein [Candidatus Babeliales bacterium]
MNTFKRLASLFLVWIMLLQMPVALAQDSAITAADIASISDLELESNEALAQELAPTKLPSVYEVLAYEMLPAEAFQPNFKEQEFLAETGNYKALMKPKLGHAQKTATVLQLFWEAEQKNVKQALGRTRRIVGDDTRADLETFVKGNLFKAINRTKSIFGEVALAGMLVESRDTIDVLQKRQNVVKQLVHDQALFDALDHTMDSVKVAEDSFLPFFLDARYGRQQMASQFYTSSTIESYREIPGLGEVLYHAAKPATDRLDKSPGALFAINVWDNINSPFSTIAWLTFAWPAWKALGQGLGAGRSAARRLVTSPLQQMRYGAAGFVSGLAALRAAPGNISALVPGSIAQFAGAHLPGAVATSAVGGIGILFGAIWLHRKVEGLRKGTEYIKDTPKTIGNFFKNWRATVATQKGLQEDLMTLARTLDEMEVVADLLEDQPGIVRAVPETQLIMRLFALKKDTNADHKKYKISEDVRELVSLLKTGTFKGESSFFSNSGRIFAANRLMFETRYFWVKIFQALGKLDAYLSAARLVKEFEAERVTYCFPEFVDASTPYLHLEEFWSPLVNAQTVVPNTITMGGSDAARNVILTGPNTGGKSTISKATALALVMAQSLGIAPARRAVLTPFSTIITYMDVSDDVQRGLSLFAAEVNRAKILLHAIMSMPREAFTFCIIDEMFRGTAPDQAEELSHWYAQQLGKLPSSMCIHATHYSGMIALESEGQGSYRNYKVEITKHADGSLERHYVLEPGWTRHNIAPDILKEQGLIGVQ